METTYFLLVLYPVMTRAMARERPKNNTKVVEEAGKEEYEPPEIREVWDESVGTVGLFLLEM